MRRSLMTLPSIVPGLALALGATWCAPSPAQQAGQPGNSKPNSSSQSRSQEKRGDGDKDEGREKDRDGKSDDDSASPDKVLQSFRSYREKAGKGGDQTRREIDRRVKELTDLIEMRFQMTVSLANLRAEQRRSAQGNMPQLGAPGQYSGGPGQGGDESEEERTLRSREALARDLDQIQGQIRGEIDQARNQAEQLSSQLRAAREQQRNQERQERDRKKQEQDKEKKASK